MATYLTGLLMTLPLTYIAVDRKQNKIKVIPAILAIIPFSLISGLRYYVGADYNLYRAIFISACNKKEVSSILVEPGYFFLNKIIAHFTQDYMYLFLFTAVLTIGIFFTTFYLMSVNPLQSIFLWFISLCYFETMNTVRQSLAVALFFLGIYFLYVNKKWAYVLTFMMAYAMHRSAIIFLPVLLVYNLKFNIKRQMEMLTAAFILSYSSKTIVMHFPMVFGKYQSYFENSKYVDFRASDFIIMVVIWIFGIYWQKFVAEERRQKYKILLNMQYFAVVICAVSGILPVAYRVLLYFKYIPILYVPEILFACKQKRNKVLIMLLLVFLYVAQWAYYAIGLDYVDFIRYVSIFKR